MFLTPRNDLDPEVMERILKAVDAGFDYCIRLTGRRPEPTRVHTIDGRDTIAAVPKTCGAGCGLFGRHGIELQQGQFDALYAGVRDRNEYSGLPFYELGRNFWFYGAQTHGIASTGYAVLIGYLSLQASGVRGSPFRNRPTEVFRRTVEGLVDTYVKIPSLNFQNTVLADKGPPNAMGLGGTDLFASFLLRLGKEFGPGFGERFFRELKKRPRSRSQQDGIDNLILAACRAANRDLSSGFMEKWRWPMSEGAQQEARKMFEGTLQETNGLKAEYFGDKNLQKLTGTRIDPNVAFDWAFSWSLPPEGLKGASSNYSARWTGHIQAENAGQYTFSVDGDDGIRLWIKDKLIIDQWRDQFGEHSGTIELGQDEMAEIKLEYYQASGGANVKLIWSGPDIQRQTVPQARLFTSQAE